MENENSHYLATLFGLVPRVDIYHFKSGYIYLLAKGLVLRID